MVGLGDGSTRLVLEAVPSTPYDPLVLRRAFENCSALGGLDSSLVASVTARYLAGTKAAKQWGASSMPFCVGLEGSPDLKAAKVADFIETVHHEFHFTVQGGIDAVKMLSMLSETYDGTA
ncbi:Transcription factor as1 [Datura stramonium]|uniref:Transcription factor as1 n=1 Tax=Datura stramonium TaxID=4076 RepID=A0ABS8TC52_DATST|nr:Transcription factor as1 [Datura stramonium]